MSFSQPSFVPSFSGPWIQVIVVLKVSCGAQEVCAPKDLPEFWSKALSKPLTSIRVPVRVSPTGKLTLAPRWENGSFQAHSRPRV